MATAARRPDFFIVGAPKCGTTALIFVLIAWLSTAGQHDDLEEAETRALTPHEQKFAAAAGFEDAQDIVLGNCSMCHAREPVWDGLAWAPKGVLLETPGDIARQAEAIYLQAGLSHAMPPPNAIQMDAEDRRQLIAWYRAATM